MFVRDSARDSQRDLIGDGVDIFNFFSKVKNGGFRDRQFFSKSIAQTRTNMIFQQKIPAF